MTRFVSNEEGHWVKYVNVFMVKIEWKFYFFSLLDENFMKKKKTFELFRLFQMHSTALVEIQGRAKRVLKRLLFAIVELLKKKFNVF